MLGAPCISFLGWDCLIRILIHQHVLDEDIEALVVDELFQPDSIWSLGDLQVVYWSNKCFISFWLQFNRFFTTAGQVTCGTLGLSTATVKLIDADGMEHVACSVGTGPVDSAYKAVDMIVKVCCRLL